MLNLIQSPGKYIQGAGAISELVNYSQNNSFIIASGSGLKIGKDIIEKSFTSKNYTVNFEKFNGECSQIEIDRLIDLATQKNSKLIIGIGGGKVLDTAKAVAFYMNLPIIIIPTIASSDAPCSALSVLYTEDGVFDRYLALPSNPDIVIMDTQIIAEAPSRFLVSGMGDALATYFEARATSLSNGKNISGHLPTKSALTLAKSCLDTLFEDGLDALIASKNKISTKSLENIVEANTYLSGVGFESGGLAAAHSIHNGFTIIQESHNFYHGEKVAFGTIVQLFMENETISDEIRDVVNFCIEIGLPTSLESLGINNPSDERLKEVAKLACAEGETIYNMPFEVTPEKVYNAILSADRYSKSLVSNI